MLGRAGRYGPRFWLRLACTLGAVGGGHAWTTGRKQDVDGPGAAP